MTTGGAVTGVTLGDLETWELGSISALGVWGGGTEIGSTLCNDQERSVFSSQPAASVSALVSSGFVTQTRGYIYRMSFWRNK